MVLPLGSVQLCLFREELAAWWLWVLLGEAEGQEGSEGTCMGQAGQ